MVIKYFNSLILSKKYVEFMRAGDGEGEGEDVNAREQMNTCMAARGLAATARDVTTLYKL